MTVIAQPIVTHRIDAIITEITRKSSEVAALPDDPQPTSRLEAALHGVYPKAQARFELDLLVSNFECLHVARGIEGGDEVWFCAPGGMGGVGDVVGIEYDDFDATLQVEVEKSCSCSRRCCQGFYKQVIEVLASQVTRVVVDGKEYDEFYEEVY